MELKHFMAALLFFGFWVFQIPSCQTCEEYVQSCYTNISGSIRIDTLLYKNRDNGIALNFKTKSTLYIIDCKKFPVRPQKGDSITKVEDELFYTLYKKDTIYTIGYDCAEKEMKIYTAKSILN